MLSIRLSFSPVFHHAPEFTFSFCPTKDSLVVCLYYLRQERMEEFLFRSKFLDARLGLLSIGSILLTTVYLDLHRFLIYFFCMHKKVAEKNI